MTAHWLTRIVPDPFSREVHRDLASAVGMHQRLMSVFPTMDETDARARLGVLFRVETTANGPQILLQSACKPDLSRLPDSYGTRVTRPLEPLLDCLRTGLHVHFRCTASAVRKPGATTRALYDLPPVIPLRGAHAEEWWQRQAETAGLKVVALQSKALDSATGIRGKHGSKDQQKVRHARTQFDGRAEVTDAGLLRAKITSGIGRGKAYGCGLLTVAPVRRDTR